MSNIHGFHNLAPASSQPAGANRWNPNGNGRTTQPTPGRSPIGRVQQPPQLGHSLPDYAGISLMRPAYRADGMQPTLSQRLFPGMSLYTLTSFVAIVNVTMFIIELIVGGAKFDGAFVKGNDMGGPSAVTLCNMGGKWEPSIRAGHVWRLFTATLLHAGILHILGNMFFLLRFGYITELRWGRPRWAAIYFWAGIMASIWSTVLGPKNVGVGASGALFGLVGADMAYLAYNWNEIPDNRQEAFLLAIVTVMNFLFGISSNIDNWAHLGGLIGGLCLGLAIPPHLVQRTQETIIRWASGLLFAGLFLLFLLLTYVGNPWPEYDEYGYPSSCPTL